MASKAEAKAKKKRAPAQVDDNVDYQAMVDEDRMVDPNQRREVNANTDDEGNPIATKDTIYMAKQKSEQTINDQRAYVQGQTNRAVDEERRKARAKAAKSATRN